MKSDAERARKYRAKRILRRAILHARLSGCSEADIRWIFNESGRDAATSRDDYPRHTWEQAKRRLL